MPVTPAEGGTFTDAAANMAGLVRGFPDGVFRPGSNAAGVEDGGALRSEVVTML